MKLDTIDSLNEVELRVFLRRALRIINEIQHGSNDDCEYNYNWVQLRCQEAVFSAPNCKHCFVSNPHTHTLADGDIYFHPVIPWTKTN